MSTPVRPGAPTIANRSHPIRFAAVATAALLATCVFLAACGSTSDEGSAASGNPQDPVTNGTTGPEPATSIPAGATAPPTTVDPGTLAQTEDKPTASGAQWDAHATALWDAIVADDPDRALAFFFPLTAYRQVKGISDPDHDYQTRLIAYYAEDIHALHKKLGTQAAKAQFVKLAVGPAPQWIKPGVEYNKGAYWRVFDNKLVYTIDGKEQSFLVKSMISWRGEWYVVHLSSVR